MQLWRRNARLLVIAVAVAVSATVFLTGRRRPPPPVPPSVARVDPSAVIESSGAFVRDVKGEKERFRVEAGRQLTYSDGRTKLVDVKVSVDRSGKTFVITGAEAEVGQNQSSVHLTGKVHLSGSDGLTVDADSATYSEGEGIVRAPGPVRFAKGSMAGSGVDFTYDHNRDSIGLSSQTVVKIKPDAKDQTGADINAEASIFNRKDHFMSLEGSVHIVRGDQVIEGNRAVADLTEDDKYISALDLNGGAKIDKPKATGGTLKGMAADNIKLDYAERSEVMHHAVLAGSSAVKIAGDSASAPDKSLAASAVDITLGADGATVTSLTAHDRVALDLPAARPDPSKSIRSNVLVASGDEKKGLTAAVFSEGVEYREFGGTPAVQRLVRSRTLEAALNGGFGQISSAKFIGNVQFNDGSLQATAVNVDYVIATGAVTLAGASGSPMPHVANEQIIVDAQQIQMTLDGPKLAATGGPVRTVLKAQKPGAGGSTSKMPALMQQDRDSNGSSDALAYDGKKSTAEFTGNARLFQGETLIQGQKVLLDGSSGNVRADGAVRSVIFINDTDPDTKKTVSSRSTASAASMQYEDASRRMSYQTAVHLVGPQGDVTAAKVDLGLAANAQDVKSMEASGTVTLKENGRVTTGDRLRYAADGEVYTMSGKLVRMVEANCRESTGQTLVFEKASDKLRIDGSEDSRSQSNKTAAGCVPRPQ